MYSSYTTLQRVQLAKQEYLDTQEVFLGVYAPGRNASLKASLQDQLHRKFLLTDSLRPETLGSAVGVLLVREDLFLMPTSLSCLRWRRSSAAATSASRWRWPTMSGTSAPKTSGL